VLTFVTCYLAIFIFSDYKNLYLLSILHFYHHLFAELVHLYNLPLYWVCWGHKRFLVFGCRVVWEIPSSTYASHGLINLRSSTWGKIATVLQNSALGGPTRVYKNKLCSRHQALFWHRCRGGECLKVYLWIMQSNLLVSYFIMWHPGSEGTGTPRIPVPGTSPLEYDTVGIEQISSLLL
jgi:hypothetical protein